MALSSPKMITRSARVPDLEQGTYSDGRPLDDVQYLECKLILKPDRFVTAKVFFEYGELVTRTAAKFGIDFSDQGVVLKPELHEVLFLDMADFRLYNHAFILRRRIKYRGWFPNGRSGDRLQVPSPRPEQGSRLGCPSKDRGALPHKIQS